MTVMSLRDNAEADALRLVAPEYDDRVVSEQFSDKCPCGHTRADHLVTNHPQGITVYATARCNATSHDLQKRCKRLVQCECPPCPCEQFGQGVMRVEVTPPPPPGPHRGVQA